ncbi:hypothetical protein A2313_02155 [Candidatus Roizmanbacteria bacterium RIFOXYB2_FULL_41_10]|uniref:Uncharacterized protein n=1 Tax=Candidatus Roizmanbacteria bacterium RIFOXYA1_FULL_41_12 TaxID=1802082 RepID=A0A1F7KED2_9BACT|nr:MAG: hypothetical protein US97_C0013G0008 [Microgenomates group bacterium GW2011_GWF1_38_5]KKU44586.1 MAG: hypothetical protein UX63_C0031G0008 [Microgenomates group bacterium GW2011_GWB1_46_7]OGK66216.1 MAG: hypothetical protein A2209_00500 [Candidatus Roizmanbacteria bacterium RIFOXYA1_FULL_41_12]OGK69298.1 MAG: hypothetical protein A2313_02155 [Candidatus Roizmanbacteria bacterium RIFOXYB2_FULL_41_10]
MGGPKGINWEAALEYYLTPDSEGRIPSYQDVADIFGVSKKEVGLRAKRENWLQRRQNVYDTAEETYAENRIELIKQTVDKHIKTWRGIQDIAGDLLDKLNNDLSESEYKPAQFGLLASITNILKTAIEGERTALGLPNTVNSANIQVAKQEVILPPELIQEIDRLFEINSRQALAN